MKTSILNLSVTRLLPIACLLAAAATHAQAQNQNIVLRCGGAQGQDTTETGGYFINGAGEVVFNETSIHCGPGGGGPGPAPVVADALVPQFTQGPSPAQVTELPATVSFAAQVQNFDHGSLFFDDQCTVTARSPANQAIASMQLSIAESTGAGTGSLIFPDGLANGSYSVSLACTRTFQPGDQQVVVNNPVSQTVAVNVAGGGPGGAACTDQPIDSVFDPQIGFAYTDPYQSNGQTGGWDGKNPEQPTNWLKWKYELIKQGQTSNISRTTLRYWSFVAPENKKMLLRRATGNVDVIAISISECPGQFNVDQSNCAMNASMYWATGNRQDDYSCNLEAGKTYYVNSAIFDMATFQETGQYTSQVSCTSCTAEYRAEVR